MQDLRLTGVHEGGDHLLLSDSEGGRYRLPLDEPLRAAVRRDHPRLGQLQLEMEGGMRPREVQALVRGGASAEEVAQRSGWSVEKVRRYEGPVLAEREHVAALAREVQLRGRGTGQQGSPTLAFRVAQRLAGRGVDLAGVAWDSSRNEEGEWTVTVMFAAGERERSAGWQFDPTSRTVTAKDDEARWLSEDEAADGGPIPPPHLTASSNRSTTVYDVEAEGGVRARVRRPAGDHHGGEGAPGEGTAEGAGHGRAAPIDLMSAMREHSSVRGRRGARRRKAPAVQTPLDAAPREDALPLEDMGYDPQTMPPPPAAGGVHPLDEELEELEAGPDPEAKAPEVEAPDVETVAPDVETVAPDVETVAPDVETVAPDEATPAAKRASSKSGRPNVPSWDDIMFGASRKD